MSHRSFLASTVAAALVLATSAFAEVPDQKLVPPQSRPIKVAFIISDEFTLIDLAGPMQTFNQAWLPNGKPGFESFTVSETRAAVQSWRALKVTPDYTFDDAPDADVVVVAAQAGNDQKYLGYIRRMNAKGKLMLSICTGASKFAQAGLLDGLDATTHHDYIDQFRKRFPKTHFIANRAWVHSAPMIYTAGGETSGFELALHVVELYYGHALAVETARSMEYRGPDWQK